MIGNNKTKILFFGTHEFAATILETLVKSGLFDVQLVITMPDRPAGRHQEMQKPAVKIVAEKHGLKIDQPESLKNYKLPILPEINIVVDYGKIIPNSIINLPPKRSINVHPSLLPKYRGASPIQSALINGEKQTGTTIMIVDEEMDHGPIIAQETVEIYPDETYKKLYTRLAPQAGHLLTSSLQDYLSGKIKPTEQEHEEATFTKILEREDGKVDWSKTAEKIYNLYRGLTPWPGIFTTWDGKRLKLIKVVKSTKNIPVGKVKVENGKIYIGCREGSIEALELQLEGKKAATAEIFVNGYQNFDGSRLN